MFARCKAMDCEAVGRIDLQAGWSVAGLEMRMQLMLNPDKDREKDARDGDIGPPSDAASTLLPMLVGGLVLTIVALIVVVIVV